MGPNDEEEERTDCMPVQYSIVVVTRVPGGL